MHPVLEEAATHLDLELPNLRRAANLTDEKFDAARGGAHEYLQEQGMADVENLDIVVFGSIARDEMTEGSDFDWLVVARQYSEDPADFNHFKKAALEALGAMGRKVKEPGSSGIFGTVIGTTELVNTIGLDADTNLRQTRRILVLEESRSLLRPKDHDQLRRAITARYLHEQVSQAGRVPRFLLNDVVRYWRTIAVDYQAKRWQEVQGEKWGSRLLKLRSSRKLTFAGTVASIFLPVLREEAPTVEMLAEQWGMPPLARLAQLETTLGDEGRHRLGRVLELADQFSGWLADHDVRKAAKGVDHLREAEAGTPLHHAYLATRELDQALVELFFCEEEVGSIEGGMQTLAYRYLVF